MIYVKTFNTSCSSKLLLKNAIPLFVDTSTKVYRVQIPLMNLKLQYNVLEAIGYNRASHKQLQRSKCVRMLAVFGELKNFVNNKAGQSRSGYSFFFGSSSCTIV